MHASLTIFQPWLSLVTDMNTLQSNEIEKSEVLVVPCRLVRPLPGQPRHYFKQSALRELADSIAEVGQVTPAQVRRLNPPEDGFEYELIEGERRFRACVMLNRRLKIEVDPTVTNSEIQYEKSVAANFGREGHTSVETAHAITKLRNNGKTIEAVARIMGRSPAWVMQYSSLLNLDPQVLKFLKPEETPEEKLIPVTIGLLLVKVPMPDQLDLARRISEQELSMERARLLINATLHARGINRSTNSRQEFIRMGMYFKKVLEHFDAIDSISDAQFQHILKSRKLQERMAFLEILEGVNTNSAKLQKRLKKILLTL